MAGTISTYSPPPDYGANRTSYDYAGSRDEWIFRTARDLAQRYAMGDQALLDNLSGATAGIGQPSRSDFGTGANGGTAVISDQTYDFWVRYLEQYGESDPYISGQYGKPPARAASYVQQDTPQDYDRKENQKDREHEAAIAKGNNDTSLAIAGMNNATDLQIAQLQDATNREQIAVQREGILNDWNIAVMQDATDRYIAEGNWGVQKYVAELQEAGALERLKLELGMRDKELAQRALEAQQSYHVAMLGLVMEVAKYDAELAASPRNWVAYAEWLQNRDIVVNGLTLSMAADMVPQEEAAVDAANTGSPTGAYSAQAEIQYGAEVAATTGGQDTANTPTDPMSPQNAPTQAAATGAENPYQVGGVDLSSTDYTAIANQLLGKSGGQATTEQLQSMYDSTTGQTPGFAGGPQSTMTNSLGVKIQPYGHKQDYTMFRDLMPTQQEINLGGVESVRGRFGVNDFLKEMERARPKGQAMTAGLG